MEEEILSFIIQHLAKNNSALKGINDPIFSSGAVDSFGMVQLVSFIYEQYQVEIDPATVDMKEMDTPAAIARLIRESRGESGNAQ